MPEANKPLQILQGAGLASQCCASLLVVLNTVLSSSEKEDFQCNQVQATASWRGETARLSLTFQSWVTAAVTLEQDEAKLVIFRNVLLIRAIALSC